MSAEPIPHSSITERNTCYYCTSKYDIDTKYFEVRSSKYLSVACTIPIFNTSVHYLCFIKPTAPLLRLFPLFRTHPVLSLRPAPVHAIRSLSRKYGSSALLQQLASESCDFPPQHNAEHSIFGCNCLCSTLTRCAKSS